LSWSRFAVAGIAAVVVLSGCSGGSAPPDDDTTSQQTGSTADTGSRGDDAPTDGDTDAGSDPAGFTLAGTGEFAIGTDAPYGGYQIIGEPDSLPEGCTWSIQDADGEVQFENQGIYAFLTDVPENVTFVTEGCPGWEKFE
jgi:hypothetical protein